MITIHNASTSRQTDRQTKVMLASALQLACAGKNPE